MIRGELAKLVIETRVMAYTARRARDTARAGRPGPEGSGMKIRGAALFKSYAALAARLLGADAALDPHGEWQTLFLTAPSISIRGGTDEIQRNIVGERVLGLAEEPRRPRAPLRSAPRLERAVDRAHELLTARIALGVEAQVVHHVSEREPGVGIGERERTTRAGMPERSRRIGRRTTSRA